MTEMNVAEYEIKNDARIAKDVKDAFDLVSPFIEKHTALVCPSCEKVCCIDKHCHYDDDDRIFFRSLGIEPAERSKNREDKAPCRYLKEKGCSLQRWERPFRCTFFFCDSLLKSLEEDNAKLYRTFRFYLQYLVDTRKKLLGHQ